MLRTEANKWRTQRYYTCVEKFCDSVLRTEAKRTVYVAVFFKVFNFENTAAYAVRQLQTLRIPPHTQHGITQVLNTSEIQCTVAV